MKAMVEKVKIMEEETESQLEGRLEKWIGKVIHG